MWLFGVFVDDSMNRSGWWFVQAFFSGKNNISWPYQIHSVKNGDFKKPFIVTLPKTNKHFAPEKGPFVFLRKWIIFQASIFKCYVGLGGICFSPGIWLRFMQIDCTDNVTMKLNMYQERGDALTLKYQSVVGGDLVIALLSTLFDDLHFSTSSIWFIFVRLVDQAPASLSIRACLKALWSENGDWKTLIVCGSGDPSIYRNVWFTPSTNKLY